MNNIAKKFVGFISTFLFSNPSYSDYKMNFFDNLNNIHHGINELDIEKFEDEKHGVLKDVKKTRNLRGYQSSKSQPKSKPSSYVTEIGTQTSEYKCEEIKHSSNDGRIYSRDFLVWDNWGFIDENQSQHVYAQYCDHLTCKGNEDKYWNARIRHFTSENSGKSWRDCGTVIDVNANRNAFDSGIIWSGSTLSLYDGRVLSAYTGVKAKEPNSTLPVNGHYTLQTIGLAVSNDGGYTFEKLNRAIISAVESYDDFKKNGYYLGPKETLGIDKDPDGIFMTLRDPFLFQNSDELIHIFFAAKAYYNNDGENIVTPCVGHAVIKDIINLDKVELQKPILLSNEKGFNQIECPNLVERNGKYYFVVSTTQNNDNGEKDIFMDKTVRVYTSENIENGWEPYGKNGTHVILRNEKDNMYGLNILNENKESDLIKGRVFVVDKSFIPETVYLKVGGDEPILFKNAPARNRNLNLRREPKLSKSDMNSYLNKFE